MNSIKRRKGRDGYSCFNYHSAAKSVNYLVPHWLERLLEDCEEEESDDYWSIALLEGGARAAVWNVCALLGAALEGVPAQACRLCERYLAAKLRRGISTLRVNGHFSARTWEMYKQSLANKMPLLIASSVQLAAKMNCSAVELTAVKVQSLLAKNGLQYSLEEVIGAEFDVFHALRFRVPLWTSVEGAELLAQEIGLPPVGRVVASTMEYAEYRRDDIEKRARWAADTYCADINGSLSTTLRTLHLCAGAVSAAVLLSRLDSDPTPRLARLIRAPPLLVRCISDLILTLILEEATESSDSN